VISLTKEQWLAIKHRDAGFDGQFYYGLKSSETVCRPSCTARTCTPDKVVIFDTLEDAIAHGYRPCYRCHPELEHWEGAKKELAADAEDYLRAHAAEKFSLDALAGKLHVDKSYLLRTFKEVTGSTPLQFHNRIRCELAQDLLTRSELTVAYIASAVGYSSASHFTQVFRKLTNKTPTQFRQDYLLGLDDE